jgi:ABC-2 type transport system permease protein
VTAFGLELRRIRSLGLALGISLAAYAAVMGAMYPILRSNDDLMRKYMETFPKEFLAAFGMTGVLSDPGVFYTTYMSSWLWPIIAICAALLGGTRAVAVDLERGFLDLPLATRISRSRYLASAIWMQIVVMAGLAACAVLGLWTMGTVVAAPFDLARFLLGGVLCFAFGCAIAGPTTLLSVLTLSRGTTSGIVGGVLIAMYLIFVVTQIAPDWAWLAPVSAWHHFGTTALIDGGEVPWGGFALFALFAVGGWVAALWAFARRDLAA